MDFPLTFLEFPDKLEESAGCSQGDNPLDASLASEEQHHVWSPQPDPVMESVITSSTLHGIVTSHRFS